VVNNVTSCCESCVWKARFIRFDSILESLRMWNQMKNNEIYSYCYCSLLQCSRFLWLISFCQFPIIRIEIAPSFLIDSRMDSQDVHKTHNFRPWDAGGFNGQYGLIKVIWLAQNSQVLYTVNNNTYIFKLPFYHF